MSAAHRLHPLLAGVADTAGRPDVPITALALDSRAVTPGALFIALPGTRTDGAVHAADAVKNGAAAVLAGRHLDLGVPCAVAQDVRAAAGVVADRFFGEPSAALEVTGVTGTNGKTSVTHFLAQTSDACAVIGTEGNGFAGRLEPAARTTPDVVTLHATLAALRAQGARAVAMEVSSHALDQQRCAAVRMAHAVFTNLGHDHLDYHPTHAHYAQSKARLFQWPDLRGAVINTGDEFGAGLPATLAPGVRCLTYGAPGSDLDAAIEPVPGGLRLTLRGALGPGTVELDLVGAFNGLNALAALGVHVLRGTSVAAALRSLGALRAPPGRMEMLRAPQRAQVVVDYAHNPPALAAVLTALRAHVGPGGRLHCVFGCGGERDRAKRPLMGETAQRLADAVVVTDDNPRGEEAAVITAQIAAGMRGPVRVIHDRAAAIEDAVSRAGAHDVVLIAGKGAEAYQERAGRRMAFSDRAVAAALLGVAP